ncbi:SDR family NAD(P)-dependent oxidoreductase [Portibacter lacus]|uniref:Oxidoreductase n=1 Tax=Portibacter lacus TaxID=1099794 RepID=A0AA37SVC8_9BACT|nr:SDR family oxidoreductase [Portibacter lacus]GLR19945.1 oxidoreductase [Portibacter lacus]
MKNYLIIGGSSGIGKSLTQSLSDSGHQVYATYNQNEQAEIASNIHYAFLDVLADEIDLDFVPDQLDGVVYCPGSIDLKPFHRIKLSAFEADYKLQVLGAVKVLQTVYPKLKSTPGSSVVLFSTVAVQLGFNFHAQVAASKGAIEGLTKSLAAEWAPSIRINAIAPSITNTPLAAKLLSSDDKIDANAQRHPLKKIGDPRDIAEMAAFLLSEKSSWMTGQIIHLDGGMSSIK